jgi:non-ribosomal peptide synthetase component F
VPIGKPIANTTVYILDEQQRVVPVGVYGEIYAGGDGLARGYLNSQVDGGEVCAASVRRAWWRTVVPDGNIGRWLPDGNIGFLAEWTNGGCGAFLGWE